MRLAFLSPLPPAPTGIADYAAEVLELLAEGHTVEAFHDQAGVDASRLPAGCAVHPAASFLDRHAQRPYEAAVYQMGNGPAHAFLYDLLARVPGLLVLHDLVLHHSRARMFLDAPAVRAYAAAPWDAGRRQEALVALAAYREEVAYSYPEAADRLAQVHLATIGDLLPYAFPLFRIPVEASRAVAVHNEYMREAVLDEVPSAEVVRVAMPARAAPVTPAELLALRHRYRLEEGDFVVGSFGLLTREKQVETVARAVARAVPDVPRIRLLLVGPLPEPGVVETLLEQLGLRGRSVVAGRVPFGELPAHMQLADVVAHLRYPTARETSAALLRVLAQGRPAVISDLEHLGEIPDDAVVRVDPTDEEGALARALLSLAARPDWRPVLGLRAQAFVAREHSPARCRDSYEDALRRTAARPDPPPRPWPRHWRHAASA